MAGASIVLDALEKRFGATRALAGATVTLEPGTVHGLVGENGAGKSTLIKCLAGLYQPDGGCIRIDGAPRRIGGPQDARRHGFNFVHQELSLVPAFDAAENVFVGRPYPTRFGMVDRRAMRRTVAGALARIAPDLPLDRPVKRLTIGERQIVEIARALLDTPRLIVLDEPTAALGAEEADRLHAIVRQLAATGVAVLYVSHRLGDVLSLCARVTVLRDGATVFEGVATGLDHDGLVALMSGTKAPKGGADRSAALSVIARSEATKQPRGSRPHVASPSARDDGRQRWGESREHAGQDRLSEPNTPSFRTQRSVDPESRSHSEPGSSTLIPGSASPPRNEDVPLALRVEAMQLYPRSTPIDLSLAPGEIVGLYGLVGAGRSRLLKTLWGARRPVSGRVTAAGRPLRPGSMADALAAGLAYVPEERRIDGLVLGQSVAKNLSMPHLAAFRSLPWLPWPSWRRESRFAREIGERLAIKFAHPRQAVAALSGGNQQKVLVGRWLRQTPAVLLLDEPTRGVDVRSKADLHRALRDLASKGTAILFATSDLEELLSLSDRIGLLREGQWVATLAGNERTAPNVLSHLFAPVAVGVPS